MSFLFSKYSSNMTLKGQIPPTKSNRAKRKRMLSMDTARKLTSYVIKKFRGVTAEDDSSLRLSKKRKIFDDKLNENLNVGKALGLVGNSSSSLTLSENKCGPKAPARFQPDLHATVLSKKDYINQLDHNKKKFPEKNITRLSDAKRSLHEQYAKTLNSKSQPTSNKLKSVVKESCLLQAAIPIRNLINHFENCVNFIRPRILQNTVDIDSIVGSFSTFGKVVSIQDHWTHKNGSRNQYPSVWLGATVTYRCREHLQNVVKTFSLEKSPVICVPLLEHLSRINTVELEYMYRYGTKTSGTIILIENINPRMSTCKLQDEVEFYGAVLRVKWTKLAHRKRSCEVTYFSATNAVAAALALDGKTVQKSVLRARIKMTAKEMFIHRKLCEMS